jgi:putative tryptophan/tyrosine transport system substrate-binding protein
MTAFREGLLDLGWREGSDITFEHRYSDGNQLCLKAHAAELVSLAPGFIQCIETPTTIFARHSHELQEGIMKDGRGAT